MWIRLVLLLALMTPLSAPSQAAELCNSTSYVIRLATGWTTDEGVAIQGWQRIRPGECTETPAQIDFDSELPVFYYAKTSEAYLGGVREWRGSVPLCADDADFDVVANTVCSAFGLATREFIMREGADRERTVLVEPDRYELPPETGRRRQSAPFADTAGIQRLLESSGYSISSVDGFEGRGTRRAISDFLEDAGLSARPSQAELIDALESAALARNATSGITVCNRSLRDVTIAIAHRTNGDWESRGWWRLFSSECARTLAANLETANAYIYAEQISTAGRRYMRDGEEAFCIAPARFVAEGQEACAERGYGEALFRPVPDPVDGGVRIDIQDSDFQDTPP
ncbi:DUF1036 domain-containing protein [Maricaulis sp.]|uniref:DUF1036 domain-containing protein n=1 Tax=Maricaulis sp. TaxID=1486257 RepID=UPI00263134C2|nr:DUF1036 domain-containing protein [Maricaulis sp.]